MGAYAIEMSEYRIPPLVRTPHVFHVHWPESSFNHRFFEAQITTQALLASIRWMKARGTRIVWTVHNIAAHERRYPEHEERFWKRFIPQLDALIGLSEGSLAEARRRRPELQDVPSFVVAHPHYRGEYPDEMCRQQARERLGIEPDRPVLCFFGQIKRYKNVPALIQIALKMPEVVLLVAGRPRDSGLEADIIALAKEQANIRLFLHHIPSNEAQLYLRAADLVVLPYLDILNSGTAILALSFDRPVWLPTGALPSELKSWIPEPWIQDGELSKDALEHALSAVRSLPEATDGSHLRVLEPQALAEQTANVYRKVVALKG